MVVKPELKLRAYLMDEIGGKSMVHKAKEQH